MPKIDDSLLEELKQEFKDGKLNLSGDEMRQLPAEERERLTEHRYAFLEAVAAGRLEVGTNDLKKAAETVRLASLYDDKVKNEAQNTGKWWRVDFKNRKSNGLAAVKRWRQRRSLKTMLKNLNKTEEAHYLQDLANKTKYQGRLTDEEKQIAADFVKVHERAFWPSQNYKLKKIFQQQKQVPPTAFGNLIKMASDKSFNPESKYFGLQKNKDAGELEKLLKTCLKSTNVNDLTGLLNALTDLKKQKFAESEALKNATATRKEKKAARQKAIFFEQICNQVEKRRNDMRREFNTANDAATKKYEPKEQALVNGIDQKLEQINLQTAKLEKFTLRGRAFEKLKSRAPEYARKTVEDIANVRLDMVINDEAACRDFLKSQGFKDEEIKDLMPKLTEMYAASPQTSKKDKEAQDSAEDKNKEQEEQRQSFEKEQFAGAEKDREEKEEQRKKEEEQQVETVVITDKEGRETESTVPVKESWLGFLNEQFSQNGYQAEIVEMPKEDADRKSAEETVQKELKLENDERKLQIREEAENNRLVVNGENKKDPEDKNPSISDFQMILKSLKSKGNEEIRIDSEDKEFTGRLLVAAQKEGLKVVNFDRNKDLEELLQGVSKETRQAMFESGISGVPKENISQSREAVDFINQLRGGVNPKDKTEENGADSSKDNPYRVISESIRQLNQEKDDEKAIDAGVQKMDNLDKLTSMDAKKYKSTKEYQQLSKDEKVLVDRYHASQKEGNKNKGREDVKALGRLLSVYRGTKDPAKRRKIVARTLDRSLAGTRDNQRGNG